MRILLIHQYFKTPDEGSGIRSWYMAHALAGNGHDVTVLTTHNERNEATRFTGFLVHYFRIAYDNKFGFFRRLVAFGAFVMACKRYLRKHHDFDLAYVLSTPLTTGFIALRLKFKYGIPYIFEVGDLWPEVPVRLGIVKNQLLINWLYRFERKIYANAERLSALSTPIRDYMHYAVPDKRVDLIPNMADLELFLPSASIPQRFDVKSKFVISYAGAIGKANELEFLLTAARESHERNLPVHFNIMGEGARRGSVEKQAAGMENVQFHPAGGKPEVSALLDESHAIYISYVDHLILGTGCPNKLMDGLAAGKLVIINFEGWIRQLVENHECGFGYDPHKPKEFCDLLKPILASPLLLEHYQQNARKLAEEKFAVKSVMATLTSQVGKAVHDVS